MSAWKRICERLGPRRAWALAAAGVLSVAALLPPHGAGVPLCLYRMVFGVRCPGCGLTRSVSCAVRGMWAESLSYHPFGAVLAGLLVGVVVFGALPEGAARRIGSQIAAIARMARTSWTRTM